MRVLISMPDTFLGEVDKAASFENRSRSELIREALRVYIKNTTQKIHRQVNIIEEKYDSKQMYKY